MILSGTNLGGGDVAPGDALLPVEHHSSLIDRLLERTVQLFQASP